MLRPFFVFIAKEVIQHNFHMEKIFAVNTSI